ncbi:hypothetical protein G8A07_15775 [Roseateles sp. DAIF2]|uniref:tetratricopeptide repeat protein n=1 Tax=Roseateles sp. DAIF2 TaxID=2714952 RepID=UPI0018A2B2D6|nr:tetratricopeptide repeat protein [Roseateles sp. DAIF2]QPF74233.1 hypothetical protein G8A07_15775 [Roseateles sp. DAIF2]
MSEGSNDFVLDHQVRAILVIDVVESVRLVQRPGSRFAERWTRFVREMRDDCLPRYGGQMVKHLGDGMLVLFEDSLDAVNAALEMHRRIEHSNRDMPEALHILLRAGVAVGEIEISELDVFGVEVNQAVLLARLARPGQTAVPAMVRDRLVHGLDAAVEDLGDCWLRDMPDPVRTFVLSRAGEEPSAGPTPTRLKPLCPTLAVVPFATTAGNGAHAFLGDCVADEIIDALSRNPSLRVISRLSTSAFRGRAAALDGIRHHLQADHVLSGRVHLLGDRMRIALQLVEAGNATVIWSGEHTGSAAGVFAGTDALANTVAREISRALAVRCVERARCEPMPTLASYCLLMAAVGLLHGANRTEFERARQMLEYLIERDRHHPAPHAWLAKWHVMRVQQGWGQMERDSQLALEHTRRALELDPDSALTLAIDGFVHCNLLRDLDGAAQRYERALESNPNEPLAWLFHGTLLAFKGEGQQALTFTQRALDLSPLDPMRYFFESLSATAALAAGQWQLAIERAQHSLRLNRHHTSTLRVLTIAHVQLGRMQDARQWALRLLQQEPELTIAGYRRRSPSMGHPTGEVWASSLAAAGVPQG